MRYITFIISSRLMCLFLSENIIHIKTFLNANVCRKTYTVVFFIDLHIHTEAHRHKAGKEVAFLSKFVIETDHCLKQSILASSAKIQNKTK